MTRLAVPYWHVDAFADRPFGGNQAAVMPLDEWLPDATLQAIGAENLFAETAFVVRDATGEADWELRWFTPEVEVRLCGHATLASGHVLLEPRRRRAGDLPHAQGRACSKCGAGGGGLRAGAAGDPDRARRTGRRRSRCSAREPLESLAQPRPLQPVPVRQTRPRSARSRPTCGRSAALGNDQFICTAPGDATDVVSRVFVPGAGVDEDSVTGSAHAVLTPFWAARLGRDRFTAHQASARGGDLTCRLDGEQAWLGGNCVTVVEGTFYLSG